MVIADAAARSEVVGPPSTVCLHATMSAIAARNLVPSMFMARLRQPLCARVTSSVQRVHRSAAFFASSSDRPTVATSGSVKIAEGIATQSRALTARWTTC